MNRLIELNKATAVLFVVLGLGCFCLSPLAHALNPPPDGAYPNFTTAEGDKALLSLSTGVGNTALGWRSLFLDTTGSFNTAVGAGTLLANTADENTATGAGALLSNTTGPFNTADGAFALFGNTTGSDNTALGEGALLSNTTGIDNTATGSGALLGNIVGNDNTADGYAALFTTTGNGNTAVGSKALYSTTSGTDNTAIGHQALLANTTGAGNCAVGSYALSSNTAAFFSTAVGASALLNSTGGADIGIGIDAGINVTTASEVICIGHAGANVDSSTWIGNIYGVTTQNGTTAPVIVSADGQLGTVASSERFKKDIASMEKASEAILSLRPVTFHYKTDTKGTPQFGLIAEEVAKVNPALVVPDKEGKPYSVRYEAVNAMLLNEFLKEHRRVQELEANVAEQQKDIKALVTTVKEQAAQIQKVSAQLELNKPAPQTVLNNQ